MIHYHCERALHLDLFGSYKNSLEDRIVHEMPENRAVNEKRKLHLYEIVVVGAVMFLDVVATLLYNNNRDDDPLPLR